MEVFEANRVGFLSLVREFKEVRALINKLKSRKLWLTILGAVCIILNKELGLNIPPEIQGNLFVIVVIVYIAVEGIRDTIKEVKK